MEDEMEEINYRGYEQSEFPNEMNSPQWNDEIPAEPYYDELYMNSGGEVFRDYHATNTIQLCELLNGGFDLLYAYNLNDKNIERVVELAKRRYWFREIAGSPWEFKQDFNRILAEQMNRLKPLYELLNNAELDVRSGGSIEHKERNIHSEYPQSQIKTSGQDYASDANDTEYIDKTNIGDLEAFQVYTDLLDKYDSLDIRIVKALAVCFNPFMTSHINI